MSRIAVYARTEPLKLVSESMVRYGGPDYSWSFLKTPELASLKSDNADIYVHLSHSLLDSGLLAMSRELLCEEIVLLPVLIEPRLLHLGPLTFGLGRGSCWECYLRRYLCHSPWPREDLALQRSREAGSGPPEIAVQPFACYAATLILSVLKKIDDGENISGHSWMVDMLNHSVIPAVNVSVPGCAICSSARRAPDPTDLAKELAYLWESKP